MIKHSFSIPEQSLNLKSQVVTRHSTVLGTNTRTALAAENTHLIEKVIPFWDQA